MLVGWRRGAMAVGRLLRHSHLLLLRLSCLFTAKKIAQAETSLADSNKVVDENWL